jgi:hypothetical protein
MSRPVAGRQVFHVTSHLASLGGWLRTVPSVGLLFTEVQTLGRREWQKGAGRSDPA